jgi:hypothetical protein
MMLLLLHLIWRLFEPVSAAGLLLLPATPATVATPCTGALSVVGCTVLNGAEPCDSAHGAPLARGAAPPPSHHRTRRHHATPDYVSATHGSSASPCLSASSAPRGPAWGEDARANHPGLTISSSARHPEPRITCPDRESRAAAVDRERG